MNEPLRFRIGTFLIRIGHRLAGVPELAQPMTPQEQLSHIDAFLALNRELEKVNGNLRTSPARKPRRA